MYLAVSGSACQEYHAPILSGWYQRCWSKFRTSHRAGTALTVFRAQGMLFAEIGDLIYAGIDQSRGDRDGGRNFSRPRRKWDGHQSKQQRK